MGFKLSQMTWSLLLSVADDYSDYEVMDIMFLTGDSAAAGVDMRCINVSITMDDVLEMAESLIFTLTTTNSLVIIQNNMATVTITNEDSECVLIT